MSTKFELNKVFCAFGTFLWFFYFSSWNMGATVYRTLTHSSSAFLVSSEQKYTWPWPWPSMNPGSHTPVASGGGGYRPPVPLFLTPYKLTWKQQGLLRGPGVMSLTCRSHSVHSQETGMCYSPELPLGSALPAFLLNDDQWDPSLAFHPVLCRPVICCIIL